MTKIDFAIHLFATARHLGNGQAHRVPVVALLALMILSRRADEWHSGTSVAEGVTGMTSNTLTCSTRGAVAEGLLEKRPLAGGVNGALEWRITPKGQRIVAKLLNTETPATASR
jgi:hypothetical protein